ncbi:MAG: hypothetical protein FJ088_11235 [Deltaproteobacteria bacterium]|nr:hypothetical protein [Deltaproteobacteria bacterium]
MKKAFLILAFLGVFTGSAFADVPGEIAFQGFLADADGNPVAGTVQMGFELFDAPVEGSSLWSETQDVSVSNGLFNLFLGAVNPINPLLFDGNSLFLEVKIDNEAMDARLEIASTAYCFTAQTALNVPTERHQGRLLRRRERTGRGARRQLRAPLA